MTIRVMTIVGTRPELIRLAPTIRLLDQTTEHVLVHTGQNHDRALKDVFFRDLGIRQADEYLDVASPSLGEFLGGLFVATETLLDRIEPDALLVLGDTNSALSAIIARRRGVPVYHMEAGNRSFDPNVPEEINRRIVDHVADYHLAYTEHARLNLLREGIHPSRILVTGSPMREVLEQNSVGIESSTALEDHGVEPGGYFVVSLHREENVDDPSRLSSVLDALGVLAVRYGIPILASTHPRTRKRLDAMGHATNDAITWCPPFGFHDYIALQRGARLVLSDSGTISEEAAILGFAAVTLRDAIERPEALDAGVIVLGGVQTDSIVDAVSLALAGGVPRSVPADYLIGDTSRRVVNLIVSTVHTHHARSGIRRRGAGG
jgi:UDP-N-acetyl-L-fucosamine synthase